MALIALHCPPLGRSAAVLLALVVHGVAGDGRQLGGMSINTGLPDPLDAMTAPGADSPAPGASGWNLDHDAEVQAGIKALGARTTPAPLSSSKKSVNVVFLLFCTALFAGFLSYLTYILAWKSGLFGRDHEGSQQMFLVSVGIIVGLSIAGAVLIGYFGTFDQPVGVFKWVSDFSDSAGEQFNKIAHPPPATTTLSPSVQATMNQQMDKARAAMFNVQKLEASLAAANQQLAKEKLAEVQKNAALVKSKEQLAEEKTKARKPVVHKSSAKVAALQSQLASARADAQEQARVAMPYVPTPAPENRGYGAVAGSGYGAAVPAAPVVAAAAVPAAAPAMVSPCATTTPSPVVTQPPTVAPPRVVNYMPPLGCSCKAAYGPGKHYKDHCWIYKGSYKDVPVCVLTDPTCGGTTQDAGLGTADVVVDCIEAEQGGMMYKISIDRSVTDTHLGFNVAPDPSLMSLIVTDLSDSAGLVALWNSANPSQAVKPGDLITNINGEYGSSVLLMKKLIQRINLDPITLLSQNGYPIQLTKPADVVVAPTPVPVASLPTGKCTNAGRGWGEMSICIGDKKNPAAQRLWHCPWESMMLMNTKKFGGCDAIKIDCTGTDFKSVLGLYHKHDNNVTHPPEGSLETVEYAHCCLTNQCLNGPTCGMPTWVQGVSESPWVGKANPCGAAGCERLYSRWPMLAAMSSRTSAIPAFLMIIASVVGVALLLRRGRQATETNSHVLLKVDDEDSDQFTDQESLLTE